MVIMYSLHEIIDQGVIQVLFLNFISQPFDFCHLYLEHLLLMAFNITRGVIVDKIDDQVLDASIIKTTLAWCYGF